MQITFKDQKIDVELADSFLKRAWGLSRRKEGKMLFKFPRETQAKIDMALLSKPLYLYFFNPDKELIYHEKASPWTWNPKTWSMYSPPGKYRYLLESFEELELKEGDKINF